MSGETLTRSGVVSLHPKPFFVNKHHRKHLQPAESSAPQSLTELENHLFDGAA